VMAPEKTVKVRLLPDGGWRVGKVILASSNRQSLMLGGDDLPPPPGGLTIHPDHGKVLALSKEGKDYTELFTGALYEVSFGGGEGS